MKIKLIFALLFAACLVRAQKGISVSLEAGPNATRLLWQGIRPDGKFPFYPYAAGVLCRYDFTTLLALKTGLLFEKKGVGADFNILESDPSGYVSETVASQRRYFHYLTLPALARVGFGKKVRLFVNAGPYLSMLVKETDILIVHNAVVERGSGFGNDVRFFDYGTMQGLGLSVAVDKKLALALELRNSHSFRRPWPGPTYYATGSVYLEQETNSTGLLLSISFRP